MLEKLSFADVTMVFRCISDVGQAFKNRDGMLLSGARLAHGVLMAWLRESSRLAGALLTKKQCLVSDIPLVSLCDRNLLVGGA